MTSARDLYLIDGHALAYRSYFAMIRNPLTNSAGQPTGAVFGFATILMALLKEYACPYVAVVFDSPAPTFRKQMYEQYKANRAAMPDELRSQIPLIFKLVECFNIPSISLDGFEADDIIATLATRAAGEGYHTWIVSKDKDLMQLVGPQVTLLAPETGSSMIAMGSGEVREKMGVPPERIRDLLALMGDSSDNVPGLEGVGPKTAVKILEQAGSLQALLDDPSCISNEKQRAKVIQGRQMLELSRDLVTLRNDVQVDLSLSELASRPFDIPRCVEFFRELEFHSLLRNPLFEVRTAPTFTVKVPADLAEVRDVVQTITAAREVSIDTETTSIEPRLAQLVGISLAVDGQHAWYIPVGHAQEERNLDLQGVLDTLRGVLENPGIAKIGQNLKYDYQVFKNYGIRLAGISFDTMIAAYLIDPGKRQFNLDTLARQYLEMKTIPIESLIGTGKSQICFSQVDVDAAARYSGEDVIIPLRLRDVFMPVLQERNQINLFSTMEIPLVTVLAEMEWVGVSIDAALLAGLSRQYTRELEMISESIYEMAGERFNLNSPKQIAEVFFNKLGMPHARKTKTGLSTDSDTLEKLADDFPVASRLLEYRELQKLLSTYIDALPSQINQRSGRLHSSFNQTVAATGRLSSTSPNLQNIPIRTETGRKIREAFIAPPGYMIVAADYSQIELRLLAHLSGDERLIDAFLNDMDIHTRTASVMYGIFPEMVTPEMRRNAKTINFGLMYGMGPINLSRQLKISFKAAQAFIETYFEQFPDIRLFMDRAIGQARTCGYSETLFGRRRYLPEINAQNRQVREAAERTAINTPVQGAAADIIKRAMVLINEQIAGQFPQSHLLLQVHDELVFEVPDQDVGRFTPWIAELMSSAAQLNVPLKVDVGHARTWAGAH